MGSLPSAYFDALYTRDPDPWGFAKSPYEAEKYASTLAALPRPRYRSGIEVGCSIGVLSGALAERCDALLGIDVAAAAIESARQRNRHHANLRFACRIFPGGTGDVAPPEGFDLVMLSEVLYYLDGETLWSAARATRAMAAPAADVLLVHWLGPTPDYPLTGDEAAETFIAAMRPAATVLFQARRPEYRIDLLRL
jgi:hypothetical protein